MGPADHVTNPSGSVNELRGSLRREPPPYGARTSCSNPSGSSEPCNRRHFWAPEAGMWVKYQAGASSVSDLRGSLRREPPPYGARTSCF